MNGLDVAVLQELLIVAVIFLNAQHLGLRLGNFLGAFS